MINVHMRVHKDEVKTISLFPLMPESCASSSLAIWSSGHQGGELAPASAFGLVHRTPPLTSVPQAPGVSVLWRDSLCMPSRCPLRQLADVHCRNFWLKGEALKEAGQ